MYCRKCGVQVASRFCADCGTPVETTEVISEKICVTCGVAVREDSVFCEICGCKINDQENTIDDASIAEVVEVEQVSDVGDDPQLEAENTVDKKKKIFSKRGRKLIVIVALILVTVLAVVKIVEKINRDRAETYDLFEIAEIYAKNPATAHKRFNNQYLNIDGFVSGIYKDFISISTRTGALFELDCIDLQIYLKNDKMFETIQVGDHLVVQGKWDDSVFGDPTSGMYSVCNLKNAIVKYDQTDTESLSWLDIGYAPCPGFEEDEGVRIINVLNYFFSNHDWNWYVGVARSGDDNGDGKPDSIEKGVEIVEFSGWAVQTTGAESKDVFVLFQIPTFSDGTTRFSCVYIDGVLQSSSELNDILEIVADAYRASLTDADNEQDKSDNNSNGSTSPKDTVSDSNQEPQFQLIKFDLNSSFNDMVKNLKFTNSSTGKTGNTVYNNDMVAGQPCAYTVIDLDYDGENELIIEYNLDGDRLIIHRIGQIYYGYYMSYRGMTDLKTHGVFSGSSGSSNTVLASINSFSATDFEVCIHIEIDDSQNIYFCDGRYVSRYEAWCMYEDAINNSEDVPWYRVA